MTTEEYLELERLLGKLRTELGNRFSISCWTHDMYSIGVYDVNGNFLDQSTTPTIQGTAAKLKTHSIKEKI